MKFKGISCVSAASDPGHWLTTCRNLKPCLVNGGVHEVTMHYCTRPRNVTADENNETAASTNQAATEAATPSTEHSSASHKIRTGSTCSLLATDVAKNLGLDGPMESVRLNGIQNVPELFVPLETRCGPKGCPAGVRTKLGWTVIGRLPGYIEDGESVYKVHIATPDEVLHETVKR